MPWVRRDTCHPCRVASASAVPGTVRRPGRESEHVTDRPVDPADELLDRLTADRTGPERAREQFGAWWRDRDERALVLLDRAARRAATEPAALELLLAVIDEHGIARPALRRYLIDGDDLADAEQAALAVVGVKIDQFAGTSRFTTWLHQVASNEARMLIRARERRPATAVAEPDIAPFVARLSTLVAVRDQHACLPVRVRV